MLNINADSLRTDVHWQKHATGNRKAIESGIKKSATNYLVLLIQLHECVLEVAAVLFQAWP